ncbi:hypothetical protein ACHAPT_004411 [Fusarium lateritium]
MSMEGFPRPFPNTPNNVLEQLRLTGKVVVVTGAAGGIGFAVAEAMAEAGADVAFWYNSCVSLSHLCHRRLILDSNGTAIEKAETLAKEHNVKTHPYKVDGGR